MREKCTFRLSLTLSVPFMIFDLLCCLKIMLPSYLSYPRKCFWIRMHQNGACPLQGNLIIVIAAIYLMFIVCLCARCCVYIFLFNPQNNLMREIFRIRKHFSDEETGKISYITQLKGVGIGSRISPTLVVYLGISLPVRCPHLRTCVQFQGVQASCRSQN